MISLTKEKAIENGYNAMSPIDMADNSLAILYCRRTKFEVVHEVEMRGNAFLKHEDGCLLMKCDIPS